MVVVGAHSWAIIPLWPAFTTSRRWMRHPSEGKPILGPENKGRSQTRNRGRGGHDITAGQSKPTHLVPSINTGMISWAANWKKAIRIPQAAEAFTGDINEAPLHVEFRQGYDFRISSFGRAKVELNEFQVFPNSSKSFHL